MDCMCFLLGKCHYEVFFESLKCGLAAVFLLSFYLIMVILNNSQLAIRIKSFLRVGPHNKEILSILYGTMLGDASAEKRNAGLGTRICFYQEAYHSEYLL